jgi:hypothetical protein
MIEALAGHPDLDDDIELVPVELAEHLLVGLGVLAAVDVVRPQPPFPVGRRHLLGVLHVEGGRDDLQLRLPGRLAQTAQLGDRSVHDSGEALPGTDDAAPEVSVLFTEPTDFFEADLHLLPVLAPDVAQ